jgi:hypothetical protein
MNGLLSVLSVTMEFTADYEVTAGKLCMWRILNVAVYPVKSMVDCAQNLELLSKQVNLCRFPDLGVMWYTVRGMQVNINLIVPKNDDVCKELAGRAALFICMNFEEYNVHVSKMVSQYVPWIASVRRRLLARTRISDLRLEGDRVCLDNSWTSVLSFASPAEITKFRVLTKLTSSDPEDTVYWYKFPCGRIATFRNPYHPHCEALRIDSLVSDEDIVECDDAVLGPVIDAIRFPSNTPKCLEFVHSLRYPPFLRRACLLNVVDRVGLDDNLIVLAWDQFSIDTSAGDIVNDMVCMGRLIETIRHGARDRLAAIGLTQIVEGAEPANIWLAWAPSSPFVRACMRRFPLALVKTMCKRLHVFRRALLLMLYTRLGVWDTEDTTKASIALAEGEADDVHTAVREETLRMQVQAEEMGDALVETKPVPAVAAKLQRRRRNKKSVESVPQADDVHVVCTHAARVRRMAARYGLDIQLIGSGIFFDESDVDVVITYDAPDLSAAYEAVRAATGWTPCYDAIKGRAVAVFSGVFEGVHVDAQVWRGRAETPAERLTSQALCLAKRLETEACAATKSLVRFLHQWTCAASLKGHVLCRLPGVAVTCIAVVLGCRGQLTQTSALEQLRGALTCQDPAIDFDSCTVREGCAGRCLTSLAVHVNGSNCAARMSAATSRHALDCLAFAVSLPPEERLCADVYRKWRDVSMVHCARMRPLSPNAAAHTLANIVVGLEGNPLIDAVHLAWDEGVLLVRCTLRHDADARYGLQPEDEVEVHERTVTVRRASGRRLTLLLSPRAATARAGRVTDMLHFHGMQCGTSIPNAPSLTCDVESRFDRRHWEACR